MALLPAASNFEFSARSFTLTLTQNIFISAGGRKEAFTWRTHISGKGRRGFEEKMMSIAPLRHVTVTTPLERKAAHVSVVSSTELISSGII